MNASHEPCTRLTEQPLGVSCDREAEVVQAVLAGRWLESGSVLLAHAEACVVCRDVVALTSLLGCGHADRRREVAVPAAGQVWWRAAVRARLDATRAAAKPMSWLQGLTALLLGSVVVGVVAWIGPSVATRVTGGLVMSPIGLAVVGALGLCALSAPLALYFALRD